MACRTPCSRWSWICPQCVSSYHSTCCLTGSTLNIHALKALSQIAHTYQAVFGAQHIARYDKQTCDLSCGKQKQHVSIRRVSSANVESFELRCCRAAHIATSIWAFGRLNHLPHLPLMQELANQAMLNSGSFTTKVSFGSVLPDPPP